MTLDEGMICYVKVGIHSSRPTLDNEKKKEVIFYVNQNSEEKNEIINISNER